jgi:hypothetical protein
MGRDWSLVVIVLFIDSSNLEGDTQSVKPNAVPEEVRFLFYSRWD